MVQAFEASAWEVVEARDRPQLHSEIEASLGYMRPCLKNKSKESTDKIHSAPLLMVCKPRGCWCSTSWTLGSLERSAASRGAHHPGASH